MIEFPRTREELQIFGHNQEMLRQIYEENRYKKYLERLEKHKLYEREQRRLRKSSLSKF